MLPEVKRYEIRSAKVREELNLLFLADLHGMIYGENNDTLIQMCSDLAPDAILSGGDMLTCRYAETYHTAARFLSGLAQIAPVFAVNGNHETCARLNNAKTGHKYSAYLRRVRESGVTILNNHSEQTTIKNTPVTVTGYEAPISAYRKLRIPQLDPRTLPAIPGGRDETFSVLLAHNPAFGRAYLTYGADLTLSGHYHGGLMRFGKNSVLVSPYGIPLPRFGYGLYQSGNHHLIVTAGLGDHAIPKRIHNPFEIVMITVMPSQ